MRAASARRGRSPALLDELELPDPFDLTTFVEGVRAASARRRRSRALLEELELPDPFDLTTFVEQVGRRRGRPIHLEPVRGAMATARGRPRRRHPAEPGAVSPGAVMTWVLAPAAIALWVLALSRLRVSATSRAQSVMTATVVCLAAAVTLNLPAIWQEMVTAGGEPVVIVADHLLAMAVQMLILLFVHEIRGRGMSTRAIVGTTLAVVTATTATLLIFGPTSEAMLYKNVIQHYPGGWPWLAYWSLTIVFGFWAFGSGARFYWRYPRQAGAPGEALGFVLIGVGTTIALLLTVLRAGVLISAPLRQFRVWDGWAIPTAFVLTTLLSAVIVAGLMTRPAVSLLAHFKIRRAHQRSVTALEPLWRALTDVVPNIALGERAMVSLIGGRLSPRDKLYRRMIEVNDGLLALVPYTSAPLWHDTLDQALATGEDSHRAHVVADTVALQVALARYRARSPAAQNSAHLVTRQAGDFPAEIERLSELARASTNCPLTAQITQRTLEMESA